MGWETLALIALWVATVGQVGFVVVYGAGPWWRDFVGRALFFKSASLALVLAVTLLNWYVTYPGQLAVGAVLMCVVAAAIVYQFGALLWQRLLARR